MVNMKQSLSVALFTPRDDSFVSKKAEKSVLGQKSRGLFNSGMEASNSSRSSISSGEVAAFTCPILYEKYQKQIDHYCGLVNSYLQDIVKKIQAKVHGLKNKAE
ncbi:reticulon-4a isoform X1 [Tachysurus ichikawai]